MAWNMRSRPLLGGSACRITLDEEEFAQCRVFLRAVGEFAGKPAASHDGLALDHLAGLARRVACLGCEDDLLDNGFRVVGVFLEVGLEHVGHGLADGCADLCVAEFGLGLALELRFCHLHTDNTRVKPSRKSSPLMSNFNLSNMPLLSAYFFKVLVNPRRKPVRCVPPSWVLMLLT